MIRLHHFVNDTLFNVHLEATVYTWISRYTNQGDNGAALCNKYMVVSLDMPFTICTENIPSVTWPAEIMVCYVDLCNEELRTGTYNYGALLRTIYYDRS